MRALAEANSSTSVTWMRHPANTVPNLTEPLMTIETKPEPAATQSTATRPYTKPAVQRMPLSEARLGNNTPQKIDLETTFSS